MNTKDERRSHMEDRGIIFIWGTIDDAMAESVCRDIIELNMDGRAGCIQMLINSTGGSCQAGFAIIDMMEWSRIPVCTAGFGIVGSMATLIFIAGEKGRRVITPGTALLVHHYKAMNAGSYPDLISMRKYEDFLYNRVVAHYRKHSALKNESDVLAGLLRDVDHWITPDEALTLGLADAIQNAGPKAETRSWNR